MKDDNVVQAMQQAQAKSVDAWAWYQAKKTRQQFGQATADSFEVGASAGGPSAKKAAEKAAFYRAEAARQKAETADVEREARAQDAAYEKLNLHDDQFDLADAAAAIAISLFAMTSLTRKRWLFALALVPALFGVIMGLAGFFRWGLHPEWIVRFLS